MDPNGSSWESTVWHRHGQRSRRYYAQLGGDPDTNGNKITFADGDTSSNYAGFGNADDPKIFQQRWTSQIVRETGTGKPYLQSDNNVILGSDSGTETHVKGIYNGGTELYHNDNPRLNTSASGVTIVGEVHTEGATPIQHLKELIMLTSQHCVLKAVVALLVQVLTLTVRPQIPILYFLKHMTVFTCRAF